MKLPVSAIGILVLTGGCAWLRPPADSTTGLGTVQRPLESYFTKDDGNDSRPSFPWYRHSSDFDTANQKEMERKMMREAQRATDHKVERIMERSFR